MQEERFNQIVEAQIDMALATFQKKNNHYSGDQIVDRLAGVKRVAEIRGVDNFKAIAGMMAKHTKSIYDMLESGEHHSLDIWNEKINDHINYLLLTIAAVHDERDELAVGADVGQPDDLNDITLKAFKTQGYVS